MSAAGDGYSGLITDQGWDRVDKAIPGPVDEMISDSPFPPIGEYGFLSDCETTALVAPSGNVEWMCLPRIDSPSVFGAMLDRSAGGFRLGPEGVTVPAARRYLPGTMVLETSWSTPTGWLVVRDALLIGPWHHDTELSHTHRRTPTDYDADHVLLRTIRCVTGEVQVTFNCEPVFDYGRYGGIWSYTDRGYGQGICRAAGADVGIWLTLTTDMRLGFEGGGATARTRMREGERHFCALSWTGHESPSNYEEASRRLVWTSHHWQHWLARGRFPDHPWSRYLTRSALTLKGLTFAPTGAVVAAATTSLPEVPGGERNWDYRYCWLRDSAFTLWSLYALGFDWEADDFFWFVADLAQRDEELQVVYGVDGERDLTERVLEHLSGYENARPVRVGNDAYEQRQHDIWGTVLQAIHIRLGSWSRLDDRMWAVVRRQVECALKYWREPDLGIWEIRGTPKHFTFSKIMCWSAVQRGAQAALTRGAAELAKSWQEAADEIREDVLAHGVDERGVFTQHYETKALDASLLLLPMTGFLPREDPRVRATVLAIADELTVEGLVLRYRTDETEDGLPGGEGTFTICSFMLVSALSEIGEGERARQLCERLLSLASSLDLYAEEIDPRTGRHLGNFPQAFTHLALINAVVHVIRAQRRPAVELEPPEA
ncbi:MAG TPA: glycoside hydrolase family 15 protein [Streptosporangiaceae bacterium]|nr:glycoside hydrolase family 15 protein [Streptosporangiaceae bacterium]